MKTDNTLSGHSHSCRPVTNQDWIISWCYDYHMKGKMFRSTKRISRDTDEKGARKFCKKWGIDFRMR